MASKVIPIKASSDEHARWKAAASRAGASSFNAWARASLNSQAEVDEALEREVELKARERAQTMKKAFPQGKTKCPTPQGAYCYTHNTRH